MTRWITLSSLGLLFLQASVGCGRSELRAGPPPADAAGGSVANGGNGGDTGVGGNSGGQGGIGQGGTFGGGGVGGTIDCLPNETLSCGSDVGQCAPGTRFCEDGVFGDCQGAIEPISEQCNMLDDNCDGLTEEGFGLGLACDGPDSDLCVDDTMTCNGCSAGPNNLETCNGLDDNCNGITDSDCDTGDCQPGLFVVSSTPSSPNCINFPVSAGSTGAIQYPCGGGPVAAVLGAISFTGSVTDDQVSLTAVEQMTGPDNCLWQMDHAITGALSSGTLNYTYAEVLLTPGPGCWSPCTEVGTVDVLW